MEKAVVQRRCEKSSLRNNNRKKKKRAHTHTHTHKERKEIYTTYIHPYYTCTSRRKSTVLQILFRGVIKKKKNIIFIKKSSPPVFRSGSTERDNSIRWKPLYE